MSDAKKNYVPWNKGKKGLQVSWCKGLTKETHPSIAKYAKKLEGREFSIEHRKKISDSRWGENNPAWNGGSSFEPYGEEFNKYLKYQVRFRDGFVCRVCGVGENGRALDVHHVDYDKKHNDLLNLVSLCPVCHGKTNGDRVFWLDYFS